MSNSKEEPDKLPIGQRRAAMRDHLRACGVNGALAAWGDDEEGDDEEDVTVYPADPETQRVRWFLRKTYPGNDSGKNYLFIGMNPSTATDLDDGNDATTEKILSHFRPHARSIAIVNLFSFVCTKSGEMADLLRKEEPAVREFTELSTEGLGKLLDAVLPTIDVVVPMWGTARGEDHAWKRQAAQAALEKIRQWKEAPSHREVLYFRPTYPTHPQYWSGINSGNIRSCFPEANLDELEKDAGGDSGRD
ncbi:DUF1643 domain-containing protein [Corynebacterium mendelii]|uniref:DUF1643 domain-containing protein n=1 Tax=Corynebacterium mendelii TaxID=2765362 RepID=A0A939E1H5_9CORY|nr:DUF1643 domain-containing protein [Corynebacterium mendelii]MBN9643742.1 DUF1643 domain-containing protein [Corynebacterium mendelii]